MDMTNSKNCATINNRKNTVHLSDNKFVILSKAEGSEDVKNVSEPSSIGCDIEMEKESNVIPISINSGNKSVDQNNGAGIVTVSPKTSEGDDLDEFAKEEGNIAKLDNELDLQVDEFVEAENSQPKIIEVAEVKIVLSDSDDDMMILDDFKGSDDECLIVEDTRNEILIKDDDPPKPKLSKTEKHNSDVDSKQLQSIDSKTDASSSNMVVSGSSDDFQGIPVTNSISTKDSILSCNADMLPKSVANLKNSESLDPINSGESQKTRTISDHNNGVSKGAIETADSVKAEKSKFCGYLEISVPSQSSDLNEPSAFNYGEEGGQDEIIIDASRDDEESCNVLNPDEVELLIPLDESEASKDLRKRRLTEVDDENSGVAFKKIKEINVVAIEITDVESVAESQFRNSILEYVPETENMIKTKKKHLDIIARHISKYALRLLYGDDCAVEKEALKDLEERIHALDECLLLFKAKASECNSAQQEAFRRKKFNPRRNIRTVGVNVKISKCLNQPEASPHPPAVTPPVPHLSFNECDHPKASPHPPAVTLPVPHPLFNNQQGPKSMIEVLKEKILAKAPPRVANPRPVTNSQEPTQQLQNSQQPVVPQRMAVPKVATRTNLPAPNVTMTGNPLAMVAPHMLRSIAPHPGTITPNVRVSSGNNDIDLSDADANKRLPPNNANISIPTTVSNVNLPAVSGNQQNVLVPISSLLQMLPSAQGQTIRQAIVPSLPSGLGKKTVAYTYIVPNNSMAARTPIMSGSNRVQTFLVRVPNTGTAPLNNVVNSSQRLMDSQAFTTANTPQSSTEPSSSAASPLLLNPQDPEHPAPLPPTPSYPANPNLKAIPPKPTMKGRITSTGIILSWNVGILSSHADIKSYELFAYEEKSGPVISSLWKKIGNIDALQLPIACTLTQFKDGHQYYFTVRPIDTHARIGPFSDVVSIMYSIDKTPNSK